MRLYIIRHADPDYANNTITPAGHLEAKALSERLEAERISRIYVSPLGRAIHTMQYTADRLGLDYSVQDWVKEIGNLFVENEEGRRTAAWNAPGEAIRRDQLPTSDDWDMHPPFAGPEFRKTYEELKRNSDDFVASLGYQREDGRYRIVAGNRERIAIFCHGGFGITWLAHLLELPVSLVWSGLTLAPSSVTTVLFDERSEMYAVPRCLAIADTSHLYAAGLPIQPAGIVANFD
jgi:probable phosphoglycerate mutase